jgi:hypothetical protein
VIIASQREIRDWIRRAAYLGTFSLFSLCHMLHSRVAASPTRNPPERI